LWLGRPAALDAALGRPLYEGGPFVKSRFRVDGYLRLVGGFEFGSSLYCTVSGD